MLFRSLGLLYFRKGQFDVAEKYLIQAVKTLTDKNPNPYDGEPLYNLGLVLRFQGRLDEAYTRFYKACWNAAWQDAGYFACAQISLIQNRLQDAIYEIDHSLVRNWHNHKGRHLKAMLLRKSGKNQDALELIEESLKLDKFNFGVIYEKYLILKDKCVLDHLLNLMRHDSKNFEEIALDYINSGFYTDAINLLNIAIDNNAVSPMTYYYKGWAEYQNCDKNYISTFNQAEICDPNCCFPNALEAILALNCAIDNTENCSKALYYLGNLWYDKRQYNNAVECWEKSIELNDKYPTSYRNLALAYYNKSNNIEKALDFMIKAFELDNTDSRVFMELDQL